MTKHITDISQRKAAIIAGLAFMLAIITTILKWIWLLIKGGNDLPMKKTEKFWDMISIDFDKQASKGTEQNHIKIVENAKKHLKVGDIVLDCGCATGTVAIEIAGNVKKVHGIDISSKMIDAAKRKAAERKIGNIDFAQSTIFDERHKRESFDVILALNVLHLLEDTQKVMKKMNELLKPGGFVISSTVCMGEKKSFLNILLIPLIKIGIIPSMRFFKVSELEDSIANGNFQIVETESLYDIGSQPNHFIVAKKI
ncbi:MAG TPA: class I SAM-dependent methyltransferase [Candidatus Methanoperedens sp.]